MVKEACVARDVHGGHCSRRYASYWNTFFYVMFHKYFFATGHDGAQAGNVAAEHPPAKKRRVDEPTAAERVSNFHYKGIHGKKNGSFYYGFSQLELLICYITGMNKFPFANPGSVNEPLT